MAVTKLSNSGIKTGNRKYDSMLAGNPAFDPAATWLIQRTSPAAGTTSVSFSSIPSTYQHLQLRVLLNRNTTGGIGLYMQFNSNTGSNYAYHSLNGDGSSATASGSATQTEIFIGPLGNNTHPGVAIIDIHDYASTTKNKTVRAFLGRDFNGSGDVRLTSGLFNNTGAISSIQFLLGGAPVGAGTTFALYGFKGV